VNEELKRLRDAVTGQGREVEVGPDGVVRELGHGETEAAADEPSKPTKLAPRTFGA